MSRSGKFETFAGPKNERALTTAIYATDRIQSRMPFRFLSQGRFVGNAISTLTSKDLYSRMTGPELQNSRFQNFLRRLFPKLHCYFKELTSSNILKVGSVFLESHFPFCMNFRSCFPAGVARRTSS